MKPLRRLILSGLTTLSLLLCIVTAVFWVRSYAAGDTISRARMWNTTGNGQSVWHWEIMHGWSTDGRIDVVSDWGSLANTNGLVKETTWRGWHGPAQLVELRRIHIGWELGLAKFKLAGATVVPMLRIERRFGTPYVFPQIMFAVLPVVWIIRAVRWRRREVL